MKSKEETFVQIMPKNVAYGLSGFLNKFGPVQFRSECSPLFFFS